MLGIAKRFAQAPDTGAQIVERGLVAGIAPQQGGQFPALLAAIRAEGEIGEQHALALSGQGHSFAAGKRAQLEAAKEAKRPARRPLDPVAQS